MSVVIDANKLIKYLESNGEEVTSENIVAFLSKCTPEQIEELGLSIIKPTLAEFDLPSSVEFFGVPTPREMTRDEYIKLIKKEPNYLARKQLQKELSNINAWSGKHRRGRK